MDEVFIEHKEANGSFVWFDLGRVSLPSKAAIPTLLAKSLELTFNYILPRKLDEGYVIQGEVGIRSKIIGDSYLQIETQVVLVPIKQGEPK